MLHLIKLCVGCNSVGDLEEWIADRLKAGRKSASTKSASKTASRTGSRTGSPVRSHTTRMVPRRAAEIVGHGSLYWVIRGEILCRERILAIRPFTGADGIGRCHVDLDCRPVLVEPRPHRAFQGWRYLDPADAPLDLERAAPGARDMPEQLRRELASLGLL